jgi:hypothetical protein
MRACTWDQVGEGHFMVEVELANRLYSNRLSFLAVCGRRFKQSMAEPRVHVRRNKIPDFVLGGFRIVDH